MAAALNPNLCIMATYKASGILLATEETFYPDLTSFALYPFIFATENNWEILISPKNSMVLMVSHLYSKNTVEVSSTLASKRKDKKILYTVFIHCQVK